MDDYEIVRGARSDGRMTAKDYIKLVSNSFLELHGDRYYGDDSAVIGGIGKIGDVAVTIIGIEKGKDTSERIKRNFGSARPEGYRKALRLMKQAEKFNRPILCFVDTAGAYCGIDAEEHGQGRAIADNLYEMSTLKVPIISIIIGEGGSGGALGLCHSDRIWMLEDAYFSVVSPESCSNILWKTVDYSDVAAKALSLTANKLYKLKLIDKVVKNSKLNNLKEDILSEFEAISVLKADDLVNKRYLKFRKIGY